MCGIFGAIGKWDKKDIRLLALLNQNRGAHASGILVGSHYIKGAYSMEEMLASPKANSVFEYESRFVIGHTRFATHGAKTKDENAHPFFRNNISGVHNGIIDNFESLKKSLNIECEVDSECIFEALDQYDDIDEALGKCVGYWGLAWVNSNTPDKLFLSKHNCVLSLYKTPECIYFSSDSRHLEICFGIDEKEIEDVNDDVFLSIDMKTLKIEETKLTKLQKRKVAKDPRTDGCSASSFRNSKGSNEYNSTKSTEIITTETTEVCQLCGAETEASNLEAELLEQGYAVCSDCVLDYWNCGNKDTTYIANSWDEQLESIKEMIESDQVSSIMAGYIEEEEKKKDTHSSSLPFNQKPVDAEIVIAR